MAKAVIFDIDGVLLDSFEANFQFYRNLMKTAGYTPPEREQFPAFFALSMMDAIKAMIPDITEQEAQRIWKLGRSREVGYPVELLKMPEGAEEVIKELQQHYALALVTSRIKTSVYEAPSMAKLKPYFKVVVSYEDTVHHKPHPEPLLLAAQRLNIKPEEAVYIGDAQTDIEAAHAAGMKIIIYAPSALKDNDSHTSIFTELPKLIITL